MKKIRRTLLSTFALSGVLSGAVVIDGFTVNQPMVQLSTGENSFGVVSPTSLGGARNLTLNVIEANEPNMATAVVQDGKVDFSNDVLVASRLTIIWDGGTDSALSPNGIARTDLTFGGTLNSIRMRTKGDIALGSSFTLWSGDSNSATWNFILPSSPNYVDVNLFYAQPSGTTGTFNISEVTAARLIVNGVANADRSIRFADSDETIDTNEQTELPEPGTIAMFGLGFAALMAKSKFRRANAS